VGAAAPAGMTPAAWRLVSQQDPRAVRAAEARGAGAGSGAVMGDGGFRAVTKARPVVGRSDPGVVRTAMAVEARGGLIHVFFPPLYAAEGWLDLAAAIEGTGGRV